MFLRLLIRYRLLKSCIKSLILMAATHTDSSSPSVAGKKAESSSHVLLPREWTDSNSSTSATTNKFKVMQWNILADTLALNGDFIRCSQDVLQWTYRGPLILEEIQRSGADIVCLEEVDHFDFIKPKVSSKGFVGMFFPKPDSPCTYFQPNNGPDGCALFYRESKFSLLEKKEVVLKRENGEDSHQVAILVRLKLNESGTEQTGDEICVAVTHFKAKTEGKDLRLSQGKHLASEMSTFARGCPAVICGDFNAPEEESVYDHMSKTLASSYKQHYKGKEPSLTSWKFRPGKESKYTIDYIWYTSDKLVVDSVWCIPTEEEIGENGLPCPRYPSDHVALCTHFQLKD